MAEIHQKRSRWSIALPEPGLGTRVALAVIYLAVAVGMLFTDRGLAVSIVGVVEFSWLGARVLVPWQQSRAWARRHPMLDRTFVFPSAFVALGLLTHLSAWVCALVAIPIGILLVAVGTLTTHRRASS